MFSKRQLEAPPLPPLPAPCLCITTLYRHNSNRRQHEEQRILKNCSMLLFSLWTICPMYLVSRANRISFDLDFHSLIHNGHSLQHTCTRKEMHGKEQAKKNVLPFRETGCLWRHNTTQRKESSNHPPSPASTEESMHNLAGSRNSITPITVMSILTLVYRPYSEQQ